MRNLCKAEHFRFRHQKSTWILLIVTAVMSLFTGAAIGIVLGNAGWVKAFYQNIFDTLSGFESDLISDELKYIMLFRDESTPSLSTVLGMMTAINMPLIIAIFTTVFICLPTRTGYVKNLLTTHTTMEKFRVSSRIMFLFCFMATIINLIVSYGMTFFFFERLIPGNLISLGVCLILRFLLYYVLGLVMIVTCDMIKKGNLGPVLCIVYVSVGSGIVFAVLDGIASSIMNKPFKIEYLTPFGNLQLLNYLDTTSYLASAICIVVYFVLCFIAELTFIRKKDII